jgi:hypothetical protein
MEIDLTGQMVISLESNSIIKTVPDLVPIASISSHFPLSRFCQVTPKRSTFM